MHILQQIIENTTEELKVRQQKVPLAEMRRLAEQKVAGKSPARFRKALETDGLGIIAEIKRTSPSKGLICSDFDPIRIAEQYESGGAAAISVLTDSKFFQGHLSYLSDVASHVQLPVLRKDFIVDEYQIYEAAAHSASAVLLLAVVLSEQQISDFLNLTHQLNMDALVEVHDRAELEKVLKTGAVIIGINNRNLRTFEVNIQTSLDLIKYIPNGKIKISESGLKTSSDFEMLQRAGFNGVLIGETLMRQNDRVKFLRQLRGESCG